MLLYTAVEYQERTGAARNLSARLLGGGGRHVQARRGRRVVARNAVLGACGSGRGLVVVEGRVWHTCVKKDSGTCLIHAELINVV
jgi:hypothetical protein